MAGEHQRGCVRGTAAGGDATGAAEGHSPRWASGAQAEARPGRTRPESVLNCWAGTQRAAAEGVGLRLSSEKARSGCSQGVGSAVAGWGVRMPEEAAVVAQLRVEP